MSEYSHLSRPSTSQRRGTSTSYQYGDTMSASQAPGPRQSISCIGSRPGTRLSRRTAPSVIGGLDSQQIICAISEGRGVSPTVGLAFVNISTAEAVISQICDSQFYVRTCNKIQVFEPTEILVMSTAGQPNAKSKMISIIEENSIGSKIVSVDRKYWSETSGLEYIQQLSFSEDLEALKIAIDGSYFAICCLAAALKYINYRMSLTFSFHSLRIKYQPSEGTMMIDLSTIQSLELIQNVQNTKSKDCLFGLMNETLTPMGSRILRSSILQPSTNLDVLSRRYDAVEELNTHEEMFFATRQALRSFLDVEKLLSLLILTPTRPDIRYAEQSINNILILKNFVSSVIPLHETLSTANSSILKQICDFCHPRKVESIMQLINNVINEDVVYQSAPLDLRNQRTYAVKSGVNGLLDVARQIYKEATEDVHQHIADINRQYEMKADTRYESARRYYLRIPETDLEGREFPEVLIHCYRKKGFIECQTLALIKFNQRIEDSHQEAVMMSDKTVQALLEEIRGEIPVLFRICEGIAMLDMIAAFAHISTLNDYVRPEITSCIAINAGRHPVREKAHSETFIPNDVYSAQQSRFQIITGCNMSGKSTYIRMIALMTIMAQIGSFVPAQYASFTIIQQLFARVSMDDCIEANVSTFASEMRETAFILRNINKDSLAIIDELGRGTSTRDGLAIALSIAETLVDSRAFVWFATHFRELPQIMKERSGVINLHLAVDMSEQTKMTMLYKIAEGFSKEERYGLALARVVGLPPLVLEIATDVSNYLQDCAAAKKRSSKASALAKRRKLVLGLRETLLQAQDGPMEGKVLLIWMRKLQMEFVKRMDLIEKEAEGSGDEETEVDGEEKSQVKTGPEVDWTSSVEDESQIGRDLEIEDHSNAEEESQVGPQYFY